LHFARHASFAALPTVTSEFGSNAVPPTLISKLFPIIGSKAPAQLLFYAHIHIHILAPLPFSLPTALPSLKCTSIKDKRALPRNIKKKKNKAIPVKDRGSP
jgi:hypothetical protein